MSEYNGNTLDEHSSDLDRAVQVLEQELEEFGDVYAPAATSSSTSHTDISSSASGMTTSPPAITSSSPTMTSIETCSTLQELEALAETLDELKTDLDGTRLVFGDGNPQADLVIVGEAPGANEDKEGIPFVGRAGKLLTDILGAIQMDRSVVYIANILKHRPPDNRNPSEEERQRSLPLLHKQLELIQPKVVLCLGKVSANTLLANSTALGDLRSKAHPLSVGAHHTECWVTYHPAALLRNPNWKRPTWEDVQLVQKRYLELKCQPAIAQSL
ncbi:MAG: uracil-DNA glycosylase [Balneolaceae bacterium]|nr:uracil-DNA glycosylase [Balneolaceae bacterium]